MKTVFLSLLLFFNTLALDAQTRYKIYDYLPLPRPEGLQEIKESDFKLDRARLALYSDGVVFASPKVLAKLFDYFQNDPQGQKIWVELVQSATTTLNRWDYHIENKNWIRYIYNISETIEPLALTYLYTGNQELLRYLRGHLTQISNLPLDFWLHSELRGMNEEFPRGGLETAHLSQALGYTLSAIGQDLSKDELANYEQAYREKGYQPCLNWLEKPSINNWTGVVGTGAFVSSKYFKDPAGEQKALGAIANYLFKSIEDDGSYGEGYDYLDYPISTLMKGILCMNDREREFAFAKSGLRYSTSWKVYSYLYQLDEKGKAVDLKLNFGDPYKNAKNQAFNVTLTALYDDSMALWMTRKFGGCYELFEQLLLFSMETQLPMPLSPVEAKLPTIRVFDNGDCFIRSSWEDNSILLGMRTGEGSKTRYSHQRPELHSIAMGAYGEYLVITAGSASYRSPIHWEYDNTTRAANTISIDGKNQLFPGKGVGFIEFDNSAFWVTGEPKAKIFSLIDNEKFALIGSDAREVYHIPMKEAMRMVKYVRDPGFFIVVDRMTAGDAKTHSFASRLHLNNEDDKGKLTQEAPGLWRFERPHAGLTITLWANCPTTYNQEKGYMHGSGKRDYSPGGPNEGKLGSAFEIVFCNAEPREEVEYVMVLFPTRTSDMKPEITFSNDKLTVNGINVDIPGKR